MQGHWSAAELAELDSATIATVLGQDPEHPLMADYAAALRDVGEHVEDRSRRQLRGCHRRRSGARPRSSPICSPAGGLRRRLDLRRPADSLLQARPDRRRRRHAPALAAASRPRSPHRLRRQPRPPRAPPRRCAAPRSRPGGDGSTPVSCSSTAPRRRSSCAPAPSTRSSCSPPPQRSPPAEIDGILWNRGRAPRYKSLPRPRSRNTAY